MRLLICAFAAIILFAACSNSKSLAGRAKNPDAAKMKMLEVPSNKSNQ